MTTRSPTTLATSPADADRTARKSSSTEIRRENSSTELFSSNFEKISPKRIFIGPILSQSTRRFLLSSRRERERRRIFFSTRDAKCEEEKRKKTEDAESLSSALNVRNVSSRRSDWTGASDSACCVARAELERGALPQSRTRFNGRAFGRFRRTDDRSANLRIVLRSTSASSGVDVAESDRSSLLSLSIDAAEKYPRRVPIALHRDAY